MTELLVGEPTGIARARMMLQRAHWAATAYATFDRRRVRAIAEAVGEVAYQNAGRYAEWAVRETGMGVVEHKRLKNEACSRGILDMYGSCDYVSARIDEDRKLVEIPRPAGVILALAPSTNPIATVYFKILLSLMTRNAVVVSPHPFAKGCCADAAHLLAGAAIRAGAPDGCIQVVEEPTIPLIEALMSDDTTDVIVATGGVGVVRAAYRSGNPAIGVGPGNVPVFVDATADLSRAASCIVDSKAFDNSILCTNESVLIAEDQIADALLRELVDRGAHVCSADECDRARATLYPEGRINTDLLGRDAATIARAIGASVRPNTRVLVAPFEFIVPEDPLAREKMFPLIGFVRVPDAGRGIDAARAMLRIGGAGHSAVIHSNSPTTVMAYSAAVPVLRVTVNAGGSTGSSGIDTNLAITMTIGTGFFGRSSLGQNLEPGDLVNWTRIAYAADPAVLFPSFLDLDPTTAYPTRMPVTDTPDVMHGGQSDLRDDVRRLLLAELNETMRR